VAGEEGAKAPETQPVLGCLSSGLGLLLFLPGCLSTCGPLMPTLPDAQQGMTPDELGRLLWTYFAVGVTLMVVGAVFLRLGDKLTHGR
jgi:hypothetical protein